MGHEWKLIDLDAAAKLAGPALEGTFVGLKCSTAYNPPELLLREPAGFETWGEGPVRAPCCGCAWPAAGQPGWPYGGLSVPSGGSTRTGGMSASPVGPARSH